MSPEERELLNRSVVLAEENNKILRSMKRSMLWSRIMSTVYWILIIGASIGAFYFIQPYFDQAVVIYNQAKSNLDSVNKTLNSFKK